MMKFLIDNYSSIYNTEPLYLNTTINSIEGCSASVYTRDKNVSVYDKFDLEKPNIYITHAMLLDNDVISYLRESKEIHTIINISGLNQEQVSSINNLFEYHNIKSVFFVINYGNHGLSSKNFNIFVLPHCSDIYLGRNKNIKYNVQNGIFITSKSQISKRDGTYHYLSINSDLSKDADIVMPVMYLSNIYKNYDTIRFKSFGKVIPQCFYDAVFYGNDVIYESDTENDIVLNILQDTFKNMDPKVLKQTIRTKHTCLNRTKSLLSQLPCNDIVVKLGKIMEGIKWE